MARPLRIELPGAVYHVPARGYRREDIFVDDVDRQSLLKVLAQALSRFDAGALAYCLMGNHYHVVLHTRQANLSSSMRHFNGVYTQSFNGRHDKVWHQFQGRLKASLMNRDAYLFEVVRYVDLNPVRARMGRRPVAWVWSSYQAHVGHVPGPEWLDTPSVHGHLPGRPARTATTLMRAPNQTLPNRSTFNGRGDSITNVALHVYT